MTETVHGIILDMDGTLVDTNEAHAQTWMEALEGFGYEVPIEVIRPLIGQGGDKILPRLTGMAEDSEIGKKIAGYRSGLFEKRYLGAVKAFPKTRELVERLRDAGLKVVVASSSRRDHLDRLIEAADIGDLIHSATSASDVDESKPDPDVIEAALGKLGIAPEQVLMIGDTPYDVEAAARVGVRTIALRCGGWNEENLTGAVAVYADPAALLADFEASPIMRS